MPVAKVKVKRSELIRVVEGRLRKLEADNKRAKDTQTTRRDAWRRQCIAVLEKALASAKAGKPIGDRYYRVELPAPPTSPDGYRDRCQLERTLKTLKIGAEDAVLLSPEDADHYFGPCQTKP